MFNFLQEAVNMNGPYSQTFKAYSVSLMPGEMREDVDHGGKIILPTSALEALTRLHIDYPMLFKLTNNRPHRTTHCGVLEFVAEEGRVYLPFWMMRHLLLEEGDIVSCESTSLPVATFAKFQAQSVNFLDISDQKAVLENALRFFACLTTGDIFAIKYNETVYEVSVLETKPANAVSIIECDMNVDFAPPIGYQEPIGAQSMDSEAAEVENPYQDHIDDHLEKTKGSTFPGQGARLDGKKKPLKSASQTSMTETIQKRGIPNHNYQGVF